VALIGGNEFRRESDTVDQALVALAGGPGAVLGLLPTGATNENPEVVVENGHRHFSRLGAAPEKLLVVDDESANDPALAAAIEACEALYLSGGDPAYLLDTLRGSRVWEAVVAVHRRGGLVAGSGAGAMVLGAVTWRFDGWAPGLGLAPGVAVLPHHATLSKRWAVEQMRAVMPAGITLLGVDDSTAVVLPEGRVVGTGQVTVYELGSVTVYAAGAQVPLRRRLT
jgi:cyanophycinase